MLPSAVSLRAVASAVLAFNVLQAFAASSVTIGPGTLQGGTCEGDSNVTFFKSIPYAQAPTGNLRFAPPQPFNTSYDGGSRNATSPPPACIQFGDVFTEDGATSEDW